MNREKAFEEMLAFILKRQAETTGQMERLKRENKTKSATYRQLMGNKMLYQEMLSLYGLFGLLEEAKPEG